MNGEISDKIALSKQNLLNKLNFVRKIDERRLNDQLDSIPDTSLSLILKRRLPPPDNRSNSIKPIKLPKKLRDIVADLNLHDEPDNVEKVHLFLGYCRLQNYSYNTTRQYYRFLRNNGVFGDPKNKDLPIPDKFAFVDGGKLHVRIVSDDSFEKLLTYLRKHVNRYTAPILVAVYTTLRTFEILQFTTYTLYQLSSRQPAVSVRRKSVYVRKNSDLEYWRPVYNTHLNNLVKALIELYDDEYTQYTQRGIDVPLFFVTPKTLVTRIRQCFYAANDFLPPYGFGIHSCRNLIAMRMAKNTDNIETIRIFLQHRKLKTTQKYIKSNFTYTTKEFNRLTNYEFSNVMRNLTVVDGVHKTTKTPINNTNKDNK